MFFCFFEIPNLFYETLLLLNVIKRKLTVNVSPLKYPFSQALKVTNIIKIFRKYFKSFSVKKAYKILVCYFIINNENP